VVARCVASSALPPPEEQEPSACALALRQAEATNALLSQQLAEAQAQQQAAETLNIMLEPYVMSFMHMAAYLNPRAALGSVLGNVQGWFEKGRPESEWLRRSYNRNRDDEWRQAELQMLEAYLRAPFGRAVLQRCNANARVVAGNGGAPHSAASLARRVYAVFDSLVKRQPGSQKRLKKYQRTSSAIDMYHWDLDESVLGLYYFPDYRSLGADGRDARV
jgi:hypothetical protein